MATTAKEWRSTRIQGVEIALPEYGDVIRLRPMDAGFFFQSKRIPDFLASTVQDMINGTARQIALPAELTPEKTLEWMTWLDNLICWAFIEPKVVDTPQADDEIGIDEISYHDKLFVYRFFGQPAQVLRSFREGQIKPVATVDAPKNNGTGAKQVVENKTVGEPVTAHA